MQSRIRYTLVVGVGLLAPIGSAQTLDHKPPTPDRRQQHRQQGFTDYALGKINEDNRDYGSDLQSARASLVAFTMDDAYFWSNCVSLGLLVTVTGCYLLQLRSSDKKEVIAATLVSQMWNGRVSDKIELDRLTAAYNALIDQHNEMVEKTLSEKQTFKTMHVSGNQKDHAGSKRLVIVKREEIDAPDSPAEVTAKPAEATAARMEDVPELPAAPARAVEAQDRNAAANSSRDDLADDPLALRQEAIRLRAQVDALKNRETNLLVRLNAAEEYKKQRETNKVSH
jgi:hypothetical protein